jgi:hypothetical protein
MDLYARGTDAIHAVESMYRLENTLKAGGIPLQQMMATQFVSAGNMLRRERSFDNISFDAKTVPVDQEIADNISAVMRAIDRFDATKTEAMKDLRKEVKAEAKSLGEDNSIGKASVQSVNFTSLMHKNLFITSVRVKPILGIIALTAIEAFAPVILGDLGLQYFRKIMQKHKSGV